MDKVTSDLQRDQTFDLSSLAQTQLRATEEDSCNSLVHICGDYRENRQNEVLGTRDYWEKIILFGCCVPGKMEERNV